MYVCFARVFVMRCDLLNICWSGVKTNYRLAKRIIGAGPHLLVNLLQEVFGIVCSAHHLQSFVRHANKQ